eukprot:SAG11_NODE_14098_length_625_cov_0.990494_1_plen_155_part_00
MASHNEGSLIVKACQGWAYTLLALPIAAVLLKWVFRFRLLYVRTRMHPTQIASHLIPVQSKHRASSVPLHYGIQTIELVCARAAQQSCLRHEYSVHAPMVHTQIWPLRYIQMPTVVCHRITACNRVYSFAKMQGIAPVEPLSLLKLQVLVVDPF